MNALTSKAIRQICTAGGNSSVGLDEIPAYHASTIWCPFPKPDSSIAMYRITEALPAYRVQKTLLHRSDVLVGFRNPSSSQSVIDFSVSVRFYVAKKAILDLLPEHPIARTYDLKGVDKRISLAPGEFAFAWPALVGEEGVYGHRMLQPLANPYVEIVVRSSERLENFDGSLVECFHCNLLDLGERRRVAESWEYAQPVSSVESKAKLIQASWRRAIGTPSYALCRQRLVREFDDLLTA